MNPEIATQPAPAEADRPLTGAVALIVGRRPRTTLMRIFVLIAVTFVLLKWAILPVRVTGISMEPTFHNHSVKIVNRLAYRWSDPKRGDIVSIGELGNPEMFMKRIVALPGETYSMRHGQLYIDGKLIPEPYVINRAPWQIPPVTLNADEYLVIGDNRGMRKEDHTFGRTERRYIVGKVLF